MTGGGRVLAPGPHCTRRLGPEMWQAERPCVQKVLASPGPLTLDLRIAGLTPAGSLTSREGGLFFLPCAVAQTRSSTPHWVALGTDSGGSALGRGQMRSTAWESCAFPLDSEGSAPPSTQGPGVLAHPSGTLPWNLGQGICSPAPRPWPGAGETEAAGRKASEEHTPRALCP